MAAESEPHLVTTRRKSANIHRLFQNEHRGSTIPTLVRNRGVPRIKGCALAIVTASTAEKWEWTTEELKDMSMEELMFNLARVVLRIGDITAPGDGLSLGGS